MDKKRFINRWIDLKMDTKINKGVGKQIDSLKMERYVDLRWKKIERLIKR